MATTTPSSTPTASQRHAHHCGEIQDKLKAKEDRPSYEVGAYPLMEAGITKADEQPILVAGGFGDVLKSGCIMCPFAPVGTFWALRELHPQLWAQVIDYENAANAVNDKMRIKRGHSISDRVDTWRARHPTATIEGVLSKGYSQCQKPDDDDDGGERAGRSTRPRRCHRSPARPVGSDDGRRPGRPARRERPRQSAGHEAHRRSGAAAGRRRCRRQQRDMPSAAGSDPQAAAHGQAVAVAVAVVVDAIAVGVVVAHHLTRCLWQHHQRRPA